MKRYCRQRDRFRCGPIALLNLDKWLGIRATFRDIEAYVRRCRCSRTKGTLPRNFSKAIGQQQKRLPYGRFKRFIASGGAAILRTLWRPRHGHYYLVDRVSAEGYRAVNFASDETISQITPTQMCHLLRHSILWTVRK